MKRVVLVASILLSSSINAQTLTFNQGWNLVGAASNISYTEGKDKSKFNG